LVLGVGLLPIDRAGLQVVNAQAQRWFAQELQPRPAGALHLVQQARQLERAHRRRSPNEPTYRPRPVSFARKSSAYASWRSSTSPTLARNRSTVSRASR